MVKIDFKKEFKQLYNPPKKEFTEIDVPPMAFLMVDGHGDPNSDPSYAEAISALYGVAYTLKFMSKGELKRDYTVPPLEGLWWAGNMDVFTGDQDKSQWDWTMMVMCPDWISPEMVDRALAEAGRKKELPSLAKIRLESYHEGHSVQILHIGPFADEGPTLHRMHTEYMPANGLTFNGKHHEIYLSDMRRVPPEKYRTVLRQPVRKI